MIIILVDLIDTTNIINAFGIQISLSLSKMIDLISRLIAALQ